MSSRRYPVPGPGAVFRPFRTAVPNLVGWSALAGAAVTSGLLGAGAGQLAGLGRGVRVALGAAGAIAPPLAAVVADRRRWNALESSVGWGAPSTVVGEIVEDLRARGVSARRVEKPGGYAEAPAGAPEPRIVALPPQVSLVYRNADRAAVSAVLRDNGVELTLPR